MRHLKGWDGARSRVSVHIGVGSCLWPLIDDYSLVYVEQAEPREWDLALIRKPNGHMMIKQLARLNGELVMLSQIPPLKLGECEILGRVVAVSEKPWRWLRWLLWGIEKKAAATARSNHDTHVLYMLLLQKKYGQIPNPPYPTWQPARLEWAA